MTLRITLLLIAVLAGVSIGYYAVSRPTEQPQTTFTQPFAMTNQNGQLVTEKTFLGRPTLYFFGFTHCPDICPTTLGNLSVWLDKIGPANAAKLNVVFISVDPERDTPAALKTYLQAFNPQIIGLSSTPEQLAKTAKQFMVYYAKVPEKNGDYTMNHSAMILMADTNGTFKGTISHEDDEATALAKIHKLIGS